MRSIVVVGSFVWHSNLGRELVRLDTRAWLRKPEPPGPKEQLWKGIRDKHSKFTASSSTADQSRLHQRMQAALAPNRPTLSGLSWSGDCSLISGWSRRRI